VETVKKKRKLTAKQQAIMDALVHAPIIVDLTEGHRTLVLEGIKGGASQDSLNRALNRFLSEGVVIPCGDSMFSTEPQTYRLSENYHA